MKHSNAIVGVVAKPGNELSKPLVTKLINKLRKDGVSFRLDNRTASHLELSDVSESDCLRREELTSGCSHIVVLGGDGTLISVCRHPTKRPPVIIGINLGTLGFLTEITVNELFTVLDSCLAGKSRLERRYLMKVSIEREGEKPRILAALNDLVISKDSLARIFPTEISVDGEFAALLRGDGVIIATPGGSTAYSLAAGGSIVHPQVDAILVTPICPHSLTSRPLVLPGSSNITLKLGDRSEETSISLTLDGQEGERLSVKDQVRVTTSRSSLLFAKSPSNSYFDILGKKLKWAAR
jgi:NAD+ kinase